MNDTPKHPYQPLITDEHGTLRFKRNEIVCRLLDAGRAHGLDMNALATMNFSREDRVQFAQLIGYSLSGFGELSAYVSDVDVEAARLAMYEGETSDSARVRALEETLAAARNGMAAGVAALYERHPDDFRGDSR